MKHVYTYSMTAKPAKYLHENNYDWEARSFMSVFETLKLVDVQTRPNNKKCNQSIINSVEFSVQHRVRLTPGFCGSRL
jgi:hypothetical protein